MTEVHKRQAPGTLSRDEVGDRFRRSGIDPALGAADDAIRRMEVIARETYPDSDGLRRVDLPQAGADAAPRVLMICASPRDDRHLMLQAAQIYAQAGIEVDAVEQSVDDWNADVCERWTAAHAIHLITGSNGPPTTSSVMACKHPTQLAGRAYVVTVHGDEPGVQGVRRQLSDWLDWMGLIDAGAQARLDRFIGYYEPQGVQQEAPVETDARNIVHAMEEIRAGQLSQPDLWCRTAHG